VILSSKSPLSETEQFRRRKHLPIDHPRCKEDKQINLKSNRYVFLISVAHDGIQFALWDCLNTALYSESSEDALFHDVTFHGGGRFFLFKEGER
jgi:hypothetical protein